MVNKVVRSPRQRDFEAISTIVCGRRRDTIVTMGRWTWMCTMMAGALAFGCGGLRDNGDDASKRHGAIKIQFARAENQPTDPFGATTMIDVVLAYGECLIDFYEENPNWRQDGPDGGPVFESAPGVCDDDSPGSLACVVESIVQELEVTNTLRVQVSVLDPSQIDGRVLRVGPLPTAEMTGCDPRVSVQSVSGSNGVTAVWAMRSFSPTSGVTDQGGEILVRIGPPE
jgi:hypothetical protein